MPLKKKYHINQLRDYSTLFLRSEVNRLLKGDFSAIDLKIKRYDSAFCGKISYLNYLKHAYKVIGRFYANEYVVKNEFINKWLIGELGDSNSIVFNEFRIGTAIADLAMFNGTSRAFEIKTSLDKEQRLFGQLEGYRRIFNEIYLIVPDTKLDKYLNISDDAGVISYNEASGQFNVVKKSMACMDIDVDVLMTVLHTHEYKSIVSEYFGFLPTTTSFGQFEMCSKMIAEIPNEVLNSLFIKTMKRRKVNNIFCKRRNSELNQVCLAMNLNLGQIDLLISNLDTVIAD